MRKSIPFIPGEMLQAPLFRILQISHGQPHPAEIEELGLHRHDCYEMFWVTGGSGVAQVDFQSYRYMPNSLLVVAPGQVHGWISGENDIHLSGWILIFSKDLLSPAERHPLNQLRYARTEWLGDSPFYCVEPEQVEALNHLFALLEREQSVIRRDREAAIKSCLQLLMIEIGRMELQRQQPHREEAGFHLAKQFLARLEEHFHRTVGIADYAAMLHVSRNHFIESIKRTLGQSPGEILQERRLLEAKRLLCYSEVSVSDIAVQVGFLDPSYFGRLFKQKIGMTPTQFRLQGLHLFR